MLDLDSIPLPPTRVISAETIAKLREYFARHPELKVTVVGTPHPSLTDYDW